MTLIDYIQSLRDFLNECPECAEMTVVMSSDDEGNSYNDVVYTPSKGWYIDQDRDFISEDVLKEGAEEDGEDYDPAIINAVCLN